MKVKNPFKKDTVYSKEPTEEKEVPRWQKILKKVYFWGKLILLLTLLVSGIYGLFSFFTTYGLQFPVVFRSPIYTLEKKVLIKPLAKKKTSMIIDLGKIADKIYTLESSNGRNDSCRNLGLYNGYGYRQNSFEWMCYSSHQEVREIVINWLTTHIKDGNVEKALCMYNRGVVEDSCTYAVNYQSL